MDRRKQQNQFIDSELIASVKNGQDDLLKNFYLNGKPEFVRWAHAKFQLDNETANDIYQDAIIVLYESILAGKLNSVTYSVKAYLYKIAQNIILKKYRSKQTREKHSENVTEHIKFLAEFEDNRFQEFENINTLNVLNDFPEPCKTILIQFYYHKLSLNKIAENIKSKSANVVKTQKQRCMKRLKLKIEELLKNSGNE